MLPRSCRRSFSIAIRHISTIVRMNDPYPGSARYHLNVCL